MSFDAEITETTKYGMPCFCYKGKMFCYLWQDKKTNQPYFLLVEGNRLVHPALESGDRKRMKIYRVNPERDIEITIVHDILTEARNLY